MAYALVSKTIQFDEKEVEFTVKVYGKSWHTKEKRVDGNPTMIEQFEESGTHVTDWDFEELFIDGVSVNGEDYYHTPLDDEITGLLEDMENEIEWEYEE